MGALKFVGLVLIVVGGLVGGFPCVAVFVPGIWPRGSLDRAQDLAEVVGTLAFIVGLCLFYRKPTEKGTKPKQKD